MTRAQLLHLQADSSGMGRRSRKLLSADARAIREMHGDATMSWTMRDIAAQFGVDHGTIAKIVKGETYKEAGAWPKTEKQS